MLRSAVEWDAIIAANPFPDAARNDPARLVYMALKKEPTGTSDISCWFTMSASFSRSS